DLKVMNMRKGFIFTADSIFALIACLAVSTHFFTIISSGLNTHSDVKDVRMAYDILLEAERIDLYDLEDAEDVERWLDEVTPKNKAVELEVEWYCLVNESVKNIKYSRYGLNGSGDFFTGEIIAGEGDVFRVLRVRVWDR
ncbi:MAG: hypothetical protein KKD39_07875, partial [Candidatus Altiarchaeota archaeon]|nr:hypothetical protein [Candidatus Altiarchaeota archaeon]